MADLGGSNSNGCSTAVCGEVNFPLALMQIGSSAALLPQTNPIVICRDSLVSQRSDFLQRGDSNVGHRGLDDTILGLRQNPITVSKELQYVKAT